MLIMKLALKKLPELPSEDASLKNLLEPITRKRRDSMLVLVSLSAHPGFCTVKQAEIPSFGTEDWEVKALLLLSLSAQVFHANADATEVVLNRIPQPVLARFVRIRPQTWKNGIALRFELYGCQITGKKARKCSCCTTWQYVMIYEP